MLSELVQEKFFHQVRQQEFVRGILIHVPREEEDLHTRGRAALAVVWVVRLAQLIRGQGLQAGELTATTVVHRLLVAVHTLVVVLLLVIARLTLIVVVGLLLLVVVILVAAVLLEVLAVVLPDQVVAAAVGHAPDKW